MELFQKKEDCCGCSACASICGKHAISMQPDEEGFLYPHIDESLCVSCGQCITVCAFQKGIKNKKDFKPPLGFAIRHKKEEIREQSLQL